MASRKFLIVGGNGSPRRSSRGLDGLRGSQQELGARDDDQGGHGMPKVVVNRYIQDGLRWDKDVYKVKSGGTLHVVNDAADEGPHTLTVVAQKDEPKTPQAILQCAICEKLAKAHGAESEQRRAAEVPVPRERRRPEDAAEGGQAG